MSFLSSVALRLKRYILTLLGLVRRAMCCRRSRRNSGMLLPVTVESPSKGADYGRISSNYSSGSTTWKAYNQPYYTQHGVPNPVSPQQQQQQFVAPQNSNNQIPGGQSGEEFSNQQQSAPDQPVDQGENMDFFSDMAPAIKKQKKVRLAAGDDSNGSSTSKFNLDFTATMQATSELGNLEENTSGAAGGADGWVDEPLDIDQSLREAREVERQRRLAEHQRLKEQKERERKASKSKNFATKLS